MAPTPDPEDRHRLPISRGISIMPTRRRSEHGTDLIFGPAQFRGEKGSPSNGSELAGGYPFKEDRARALRERNEDPE